MQFTPEFQQARQAIAKMPDSMLTQAGKDTGGLMTLASMVTGAFSTKMDEQTEMRIAEVKTMRLVIGLEMLNRLMKDETLTTFTFSEGLKKRAELEGLIAEIDAKYSV